MLFRTTLVVSVYGLLVLLLLAAPSPAFAKDGKKDKPVTYAVVQVGAEEFEVLRTSELKARKKGLAKDHKQALKDHAAAKKQARKEKRKFTDPKPKKPLFKLVNDKLASEEAGTALVEKLKEEIEKKKNKKKKKNNKKKSK